ncbi:AMP-binding protein (plasmid) [Paracoccus liaowanqingii]|uniref:AMP-binding protein n=1 Tax=Paracoccus liaowanqingii TaxID=2560053 RepID=A0A4Y5SRL3_9RHOB|nr:AMP-binding protein [Paracoccus liaowanqingii]QDA36130.1 AMP-binding protein [Paracoccus liaowanqingii]
MTPAQLAEFRWQVPERFNIGTAVCDHWCARDPDRIALLEVDEDGRADRISYRELGRRVARLSHALAARGIAGGQGGTVGPRIGVLLPQSVETATAHVAITRMGCVSLPLFTLFGPEALLHRLRDSGASAVITHAASLDVLAAIAGDLPDLRVVLCKDLPDGAAAWFPGIEIADYDAALAAQPDDIPAAETGAEDPAFLIYTSGTTGQPKGALHAHRVLLGHLPGVEVSHDLLPQPGDRLWTPADWAWIGGLLDVLMPGLYHGVTVVACRFRKFTARAALDLMRDHGIRNAFLPPTALKLMRLEPGAEGWDLNLRSVASGGEPLGAELVDWGRRVFGSTINEFYGQTECNMIVSGCALLEPPLPGAMGRAVPGHHVAVIEPASCELMPPGTEGEIAVLSPDPVMFLGYWNSPAATAAKFATGPQGRWLLTGDRGVQQPDGRLSFVGRDDDVISSAGYRIGPAEIEDCLLRHPAVHLAGVVGQPDPLRGHVVAAFVTLTAGHAPGPDLADAISAHVRDLLAAYEYPRAVHFIDEMPMTTTGKIIRAELRRRAEEIAARAPRPDTEAAHV